MSDIALVVGKIITNIEKVIIGKRPQLTLTLAAYLCEGHILLEDVPGVAKTMLARASPKASDVLSNACNARPICCPPTSPACRSSTKKRPSSSSDLDRSLPNAAH